VPVPSRRRLLCPAPARRRAGAITQAPTAFMHGAHATCPAALAHEVRSVSLVSRSGQDQAGCPLCGRLLVVMRLTPTSQLAQYDLRAEAGTRTPDPLQTAGRERICETVTYVLTLTV